MGKRARLASNFARESPAYSFYDESNLVRYVIGPFLIANNSWEPSRRERSLQSWFKLHGERSETLSLDEKRAAMEFNQSMRAPLGGHRVIFGTTEGLLGWGPPGLHVGDLICAVIGISTLFAIRPFRDSVIDASDPDPYHLVGECYVQGLMNGEGLRKEPREWCTLV